MRKILNYLEMRLREIIYLLVSFPVSVILFCIVFFGLGSGLILPLAVLVFMFLLTIMRLIANFEIRRTNRILKTDFQLVGEWFSHPFFSWNGVKERLTCTQSWMAIGYVFLAFGWSVFSFVVLVFGLAGIFVLLSALGVSLLSNFSRSFEVINGGDIFRGNLYFQESTRTFRLELGDAVSRTGLSWNLDSIENLVAGVLLVFLALWLIPRNARTMAKLVEGLLSGLYQPKVENWLQRFRSKERVSERDVRTAMENENLQPQLSELSNREREILSLMAQGKSNAGIAKSLYITEGSVEKHISSILLKLDLPIEEESHRRVLAVLKYLGIKSNKEE